MVGTNKVIQIYSNFFVVVRRLRDIRFGRAFPFLGFRFRMLHPGDAISSFGIFSRCSSLLILQHQFIVKCAFDS